MKTTAFLSIIAVLTLPAYAGDKPKPEATQPAVQNPAPTEKVKKTEAEWQKQLTPDQFRVTRQAATERPYGPAYEEFNQQGEGTYYCVCCGAELFSSKEKFHSGCGWPSFYDQSKAKGVAEHRDPDGHRVEVVCKRCDAHLGHVFDGEGFNTPTNRRFCINGVALKFVGAKDAKPELKDLEQSKKNAAEAKKAEAAKEAAAKK